MRIKTLADMITLVARASTQTMHHLKPHIYLPVNPKVYFAICTNAIDIAFRIWNHRKAGHSNSPSLDSRQIGVYFIWDVTKVYYFRRDHIYLPICGCVALKHYIPICDMCLVAVHVELQSACSLWRCIQTRQPMQDPRQQVFNHKYVIWDNTTYLETYQLWKFETLYQSLTMHVYVALIHYANLGECTFAAKLLFMNMGSVCLVRSPFLLLVPGHT